RRQRWRRTWARIRAGTRRRCWGGVRYLWFLRPSAPRLAERGGHVDAEDEGAGPVGGGITLRPWPPWSPWPPAPLRKLPRFNRRRSSLSVQATPVRRYFPSRRGAMARLDGNGVALACANRRRDRDPG